MDWRQVFAGVVVVVGVIGVVDVAIVGGWGRGWRVAPDEGRWAVDGGRKGRAAAANKGFPSRLDGSPGSFAEGRNEQSRRRATGGRQEWSGLVGDAMELEGN